MPFLIQNLIFHFWKLRNADRKRAVAGLPRKWFIADFIMNPMRWCCFDVFDDICKAMRGAQSDEKMNVVGGSADGFGNGVESFQAAAEKGVQSRSQIIADNGAALFGAENDVIMKT